MERNVNLIQEASICFSLRMYRVPVFVHPDDNMIMRIKQSALS